MALQKTGLGFYVQDVVSMERAVKQNFTCLRIVEQRISRLTTEMRTDLDADMLWLLVEEFSPILTSFYPSISQYLERERHRKKKQSV